MRIHGAVSGMGQIAATYDLMPRDTDVSLEDVVAHIPKILPSGVKLLETKIEPVAFGLRKVVAGFIIDDSIESVGSDLENGLASIPGIENAECTSSALL